MTAVFDYVAELKLSGEFLEAMNGILLVLVFELMFFFARYIWIEFREQYQTLGHDGLLIAYHRRKAAIAVLVILSGEFFIRLSVWSWRHFELPVNNPFVSWGVVLGLFLWIAGGVCAIRNFSPRRWGHWPITIGLASALGFGVGFAL